MKRKLMYFFGALLLSGVAAFGIGCSPACKGLWNASSNVCDGNASSNACLQLIKQLEAHGCIDGPG